MKFLKKGVSILLSAMMIFSFAAVSLSASAASDYITYRVPDGCDFAVVDSCSNLANGKIEIASTYNGYPVTKIEIDAFKGFKTITEIIVPSSVKEIGNGAFSNCTGLEKIVFEGSDCSFGTHIFAYSTKLSEITLPSALKEIPKNTFYDCKALEEIEIPSTVTKIGETAFATCTALKDFEIPASVTSIGVNAFIRCNAVENYKVANGSIAFKSVDGMLYDAKGETLVQYPIGNKAEKVTVKNGTKRIADGAFADNKSIKSVVFPSGLEAVDAYAFQYCENLDGVTLPAGIKTLGAEAFGHCAALKSINIPASLTTYEYAFYMSGIESVVIENGAEEISRNAFEKCRELTSVTIPSSLKSIGMAAFIDCTALKDIEIPSSVTSIGKKAFGNIENLAIIGAKGSAAETYAEENSINFVSSEKIIGISITRLPSKLNYNYKDSVDTSGMIVVANYSDGTQEEIKGYTVSPVSFSKTGSHTVTVSYGEHSDTFGVSVSYSIVQIFILIFLLGFLWY